MATIKSFTDLEQSKKLAKILPLESADMYYPYDYVFNELESIPTITEEDDHFVLFPKDVRCWSLAALRDLLPPAIKPNKDSCLFLFESHNTFDKSWVYRYYNEDDTSYLYYKNTNEVDACVAMIEKLHELNLL